MNDLREQLSPLTPGGKSLQVGPGKDDFVVVRTNAAPPRYEFLVAKRSPSSKGTHYGWWTTLDGAIELIQKEIQ